MSTLSWDVAKTLTVAELIASVLTTIMFHHSVVAYIVKYLK